MKVKIHDYSQPIRQVTCPDCGSIGGNKGPCWCDDCAKNGVKVMMLPSYNGFIHASWSEVARK